MYASIKVKKNVRKLRIEDPPAKTTVEQASSLLTTTNQAISVQNEPNSKLSMQNMPALEQNLPASLRGLGASQNIMRHSHQSFQPLASLEGTVRQSLYLKSLKGDGQQMSPLGAPAKSIGAAKMNDYLTTGLTKGQKAGDSLERPNQQKKLAIGQLRLKPSQILQEAKNDVQFGARPHREELNREGSSLAVLCGYLQSSQSQPAFQPLTKKNSIIGAATNQPAKEKTDSSRQQEKITAVINERFIYKENSRFKKNRDMSNSKIQKPIDESSKMQHESVMPINKDASGKQHLSNFQSTINTDQHATANSRVFQKYQKHFKSPLPSNFQVTSNGKEQQRSSIGGKAGLFNAHNSVQSMNSQAQSGAKPHHIQTMSKLGSDEPTTYIPFLKQTPLNSKSVKHLQDDISGARHMKAYPSQKVFATGPITKENHTMEESTAGKGQQTPDDKARQEYMPYQVQLMSLANMSANQDESARQSNNNSNMPNQVKLKQERIIQRLERKSRKDQNIIVAPQGPGIPAMVRKSRNPSMAAHGMGNEDNDNGRKQKRSGSAGSNRDARGSWDRSKQLDPGQYKEAAVTLGELTDPVEQVKLLPLKARMIFKKAMKELDSVDLVNSEQLPMSRPRIRAILKQMKDNLEQGTYGEDHHSSQKTRVDKSYTPNNERLLQGLGKQAERDLFGMLIREKKQKKMNREKNLEMRQLYEDRMLRKKMQFEMMKAKEEKRQMIKDNNGYLSASSSDMANSFEMEGRVDKHGNIVKSERQQNDYVTTLLSSERPSSAEHNIFGSVTSRKDVERYNRMRSLSTKRKKKQEQMVLEELLALCEKPSKNASPVAGNFYSKFQNIDKIIQKEDNEVTENTLQEQHEKKEAEEELRMKRILESQQKGTGSAQGSPIMSPNMKMPAKNYLSNDNFRVPKSGKSSFLSTPGKGSTLKQQQIDQNKSPIIEYLKQAQKDNLLPHFMPFKKLQEATQADDGREGGLKYCLDQFSINTRVAPSIASAIMNLQHLQSMSLVDSMLSEESFMTILNATPKTLVSLNLSQNEHLTNNCFKALHQMENLAHLSLEKCNIRDDSIALLFDLDPHKLNVPAEPVAPVPMMKKKTSVLKKSFSVALNEAEEDDAPPFIASGLIKTIKLFNVSKNQVTDAGAKIISEFIDKSECLETLQLHWNKIRAKGAMCLAKSIKKNRTIQILDISFNSFGSGAIKKAIIQDDLKKEEEVQAEQRHPLGKLECSQTAWKWRKTLMKNLTLLHLDISFNGFTDQDMIALSDGLRENHTLLGCHVEGNNCKLDALGFIVPTLLQKQSVGGKHKQRGKEVYDVHNYDRIPISMENVHLERNEEKKNMRGDEAQIIKSGELAPLMPPGFSKLEPRNCWLCEGWTQMLFEVRLPDKFIGCEVASVYLHLSFEDFKPMVMQEKIEEPSTSQKQSVSNKKPKRPGLAPVQEGESKKPQAQTFQLYRMVPPSKIGIKFYYSLQNPKNFRKETFIDQYKKKVFVEEEQRQELAAMAENNSNSEDEEEGERVLPFPKFVNQTRQIKQETLSLTPQARMHLKAKPRCAFNTQELTRPKSPWSLPKSFFAKYKHDNDLIIGKCFDWDWRCSTLDKMIKDPHEKEAIIKYLRPKYGMIRETYKHLACVAPAGNMPSLGMNILTEIMLKCNEFVDYKNTKLSDVDLAFIATNAVGAKNFPFRPEICINPERQIIRYQFFEILIRLAMERFSQKLKMTQSEGIKVFYEQYIQDTFMKYTSHPWRLERYWNEDCDTVIKENMETLKDIYNAFAQAQSPGDPMIIRLTRLIEMITNSGVCDDNFGAREIGPLFNLAMQTNMDEINKVRHMDMQFIEFVEALARIADKAVTHNTVEFPVDRSQQQAGGNSNVKNQKKLNAQATKMMESVNESREASSVGRRSPSPIPSVTNRSKGKQTTAREIEDANNSGLIVYRPSSREPSFLREGIEPVAVVDRGSDVEPATINTPKQGKEASFNLDIQADLTPTQKDPAMAHNLSIVTADNAYDPKKASFSSAKKANEKNMSIINSIGKKMNRSMSKPANQMRRKNTNRSNGSAHRSGASRSKSRGFNSDYDQSSMNNASAFEGDLHLSEKLQKYINRIAVTCLGQSYAHKYVREWNRRNARNARNKNAADADLLAQAELLGQIGFKATLQKLRYSDQKAPQQNEGNNKGGNKARASMKIR